MGRKRTPLTVAVVALAVMLTGCGTVAGTAVPDPSVEAQFQLDTGNYPTAPRKITGSAPADYWQQEGFRVGDGVIAPWEADPSITEDAIGTIKGKQELTGPVWLPTMLHLPLVQAVRDAFVATPFQTGFVATAKNADSSRVLRIALLRFGSEDAAKALVSTAAAKNPSRSTPSNLIPGSTLIQAGVASNGEVHLTVAIQRGAMVALVSADGRDNGELTARVKKAVELETAKMGDYKPSPQGPHAPNVEMDRDGIMSRTLASTTTGEATLGLSPSINLGDGYMTGRTYPLMLVGYRTAIDKWGIDLVGRTMISEVFRLPTEESAGKFLIEAALGQRRGDSPILVPGMNPQTARCVTVAGAQPFIRCATKFGRYVAVVQNLGSEAAAKQAISAQYLILKAAGPN